VLGRALQNIVGTSYENFTTAMVQTVLGMNSSGFEFSSSVVSRMAQGEMKKNKEKEIAGSKE
jgi:hypothetical protein